MKVHANDYDEKAIMKILREWTDMSQEEFGKHLGLSKMTIQGYERGQRRYSFETLMKIARNNGFTVTIEKL